MSDSDDVVRLKSAQCRFVLAAVIVYTTPPAEPICDRIASASWSSVWQKFIADNPLWLNGMSQGVHQVIDGVLQHGTTDGSE